MKVHLRLDGQSRTLDAQALDIDPRDDSHRILDRLARTLELPSLKAQNLVVDRHPDGVVIRPPAIFG